MREWPVFYRRNLRDSTCQPRNCALFRILLECDYANDIRIWIQWWQKMTIDLSKQSLHDLEAVPMRNKNNVVAFIMPKMKSSLDQRLSVENDRNTFQLVLLIVMYEVSLRWHFPRRTHGDLHPLKCNYRLINRDVSILVDGYQTDEASIITQHLHIFLPHLDAKKQLENRSTGSYASSHWLNSVQKVCNLIIIRGVS